MGRLEVENVGVGESTCHLAQLHHGVAVPPEQEESGLHLVPDEKEIARGTEAERTLCHWFLPKVISKFTNSFAIGTINLQ